MSKHPYIRGNPCLTPCTKCQGQIKPTLDERKYACIQCGKGYNEPLKSS